MFYDYEEIGDRVMWMLAHEHRIDGLAEVVARGRGHHRTWVDKSFAHQLAPLRAAERRKVALALLVVTDLYVWKLLRRDFGLDHKAAEAMVERLIDGAIATSRGD